MKHVMENKNWSRICCVLLCAALILSVALPMRLRGSAQPQTPELEPERSVTLLGGGEAQPHHAGGQSASQLHAEAGETGGTTGTKGGNTAAVTTGAASAPSAETEKEENIEKSDENGIQEPQSSGRNDARPDYSSAEIGTAEGPEEPDDTTASDDTGSDGEEDSQLALSAALTWYKYGNQASTVVCAPDASVGKRVLVSQLREGRFDYEIALEGPERRSAVIDAVTLVADGREQSVSDSGSLTMQTAGDGAQRYVFFVDATVRRDTQDGEKLLETSFVFVVSYEDGLDLSVEMRWPQTRGETSVAVRGDGSAQKDVRSSDLTDGTLHYSFTLLGQSAKDARIVSASYTTPYSGSGALDKAGGTLALETPQDRDSQRYTVTLTAEVTEGGETRMVLFTIYLDYKNNDDLSLELTWYRGGVTAERVTCAKDAGAAAKIKQNQLINGSFSYHLALTGANAEKAKLLSARLTGPGLDQTMQESGSAVFSIPAGQSASVYTVEATAELESGKRAAFTITITYTSDVSVELRYALTVDGRRTEQTARCENGRTATPEIVFSDQLEDGMLPFVFALAGEDASAVTLRKLTLFQSGSGKTRTLAGEIGAPEYSGTVQLLDNGGRAGENQFKLTASDADGGEYVFTFLVRYQKRGDKEVRIQVNLTEGQEIPNETDIPLRVQAWSCEEDGTVISHILATGSETELRVELDGERLAYTGASGYTQEYVLNAKNPVEGDENTHTLCIYARDEYGNEGTLELTFKGIRSEEGKETGATVQVSVDLTVLGLGVYGPVSYPVRVGEPVSYVVAKTVWGDDTDDTFGDAAEQTLGFDRAYCSYSGTLRSGFYLKSLGGSLLGAPQYFPQPSNAASQEEILAAIDSYFGAGSDLATLWRCIVRNNIPIKPPGTTSFGEFDFSQGSGWLYLIDGGEYPNHGMSEHYLSDLTGDSHTLTLRYTLAYGWDVGSGASGYGDAVGYCIQAGNGGFAVSHQFQPQTDENGVTKYVCRCCGLEEGCPHAHTEPRDKEDGTCGEFCLDCQTFPYETHPHMWEYSFGPDSAEHTKTCTSCGRTETEPHVWDTTKTEGEGCEEPGSIHSVCTLCGMEKDEQTPPPGHNYSDFGADEYAHWTVCAVCGQEEPGSRAAHAYALQSGRWVCTGCGLEHGENGVDCPGELILTEHDCRHRAYVCSHCGLRFCEEGEFDDHVYKDGFCTICGAPDPNPAAPPPEKPDPENPEPDPEVPDPEP